MAGRIIIFGAGGHAKVVIDAIERSANRPDIVLVDNDPGKRNTYLCSYRIMMPDDVILTEDSSVVVAVGANKKRLSIAEGLSKKRARFTSIVDPTAVVSASVELGTGTVVFAGAVVNRDTRIENHCIINTNASVDHDCQIGDGVHIGPGATLCGSVKVGKGSFIGAGCTILPNLSIGENTIVGAGSTILKSIESNVTVYISQNLKVRNQ